MRNDESVPVTPELGQRVPAYSLNSVRNALQIIRYLLENDGATVTDIATELGVAMSTAHRLLSTLKHESFVIQSPSTKRYMLGSVLSPSMPTQFVEDLVTIARDPLRRVVDAVGETGHIVVRNGRNVDFVLVEESSRIVRLTSRLGKSLPAHATSSGKAMLAYLSSSELHRLYPEETLPSLTSHTKTRRSDLEAELAEVRETGYALNKAESEDDVSAISAPILDRNGIPICAISLAGPSQRFPGVVMTRPTSTGKAPAELVLQTANEIAKALVRA